MKDLEGYFTMLQGCARPLWAQHCHSWQGQGLCSPVSGRPGFTPMANWGEKLGSGYVLSPWIQALGPGMWSDFTVVSPGEKWKGREGVVTAVLPSSVSVQGSECRPSSHDSECPSVCPDWVQVKGLFKICIPRKSCYIKMIQDFCPKKLLG